MPSSLPTVDEISSMSGTEPSVGGDEGTADRLNEAPRCPDCGSCYYGEWNGPFGPYWLCLTCNIPQRSPKRSA